MSQSISGLEKTTVIIGFAESLSAPEVVWSLVDNGFLVVAFTRRERRSALRHSRFVRLFSITPPEEDSVRAVEDLRRVVMRIKSDGYGPVVLMALDDEAVWLLSHDDYSGLATLIGPTGDAALIALEKKKQLELARASGFSVPAARYIERPGDIGHEYIKYPVIFKPAAAVIKHGAGLLKGRNWICSDWTELKSALKQWSGQLPMILQDFVPGVGEGLFGLATPHGVIAWSGHRRLRMMNPHGSGASACTIVAKLDENNKSAAERFLMGCGWRGLFMIEMLRDESGKLWFMEFNGRSWGSMALARRAGLEYPAWAVQVSLKPEFQVKIPRKPDRPLVCRHLGREILYLLFILRGPKSKALTNWPSIPTAFRQVLRVGRDDSWYNWRKDDAKVFIADCYGTIRDQFIKSRA